MRIALLTQSYPPMISGAALFVERLADGLAQRGHAVLVLSASDNRKPYRETHPNLEVVRLRSYHNPLRVGQRFALWPHRQIGKTLEGFAPQVIHLHDPLQLALSSLAFAQRRRIPAILTIHQLPWFVGASLPVGSQVRKLLENGLWVYARWISRRFQGVVVNTQTIAELVSTRTGVQPQVISCGVDLEVFQPEKPGADQAAALRTRLGIPAEAPIILHVGRLDADKQVERVIRAAALALQDTPAHLLVVGDGKERTSLETLSARLGIGERSHFPGYISVQDGLAGVYQTAAVFATASEIETQGLVLLEAAACGLPIVAVQATSLHEIVHEGDNGYLVPPGDIQAMADRISALVRNPALAEAMGKAGREIAQGHASEKTVEAYEAYYRTVIEAKGARQG